MSKRTAAYKRIQHSDDHQQETIPGKHKKSALTIIAVFFGFLLVLGLIAKSYKYQRIPATKRDVVSPTANLNSTSCRSRNCKRILNPMNLEVDPCQDFYQYSCGNWHNIHKRPQNSQHWTNFVRLDKKNSEVIRKGLEGRGRLAYDHSAVRLARRFYAQCNRRNQQTFNQSRKILDSVLSAIDFSISNKSGAADLGRLLANLYSNHGLQPFFSWKIRINELDSSKHILHIDQPDFILGERYLYKSKDKVKGSLSTYIRSLLSLLDREDSLEGRTDLITNITNLEISLALEEDRPEVHRKLLDKPVLSKIGDLEKEFGFMDWKAFIDGTVHSADGDTLPNEEQVLIVSDRYMRIVSERISDLTRSAEGRSTLSVFLVWRLLDALVPGLSSEFRIIKQRLMGDVRGMENRSLKMITWKQCLKETGKNFKNVLSWIYLSETGGFESDTVEEVEEILDRVHDSVNSGLKKSTWMDKTTKKAALAKSKKIKGLVGFPKYLSNKKRLSKQYKDVVLGDTFIESSSIFRKSNLEPIKLWNKLHKGVADHSWTSAAEKINAYYAPSINQIQIPIGILQDPFFSASRPQEMNYGGVGFSMGHELCHAFDDRGRQFNGDGNLEDWWAQQTVEKFKEKTQCLIDQYETFSLFNLTVNGRNTLGETIADNGGIKAAYRAFQEYQKEEEDFQDWTEMRKELGFNSEQLFFIGFAQVWCSHNTRDYEIEKLLSNPHPPSQVRVNAALSNSPNFAAAFGCAPETPMNPVDKCDIW